MIFLKKNLPILGLAIIFTTIVIAVISSPASATSPLRAQVVTPTPNPNLSIGNDTCLECHGKPGLSMTLDNGDVLDLFVDPQVYASSIHGKDKYACVQCHTTVGNFPHPPFTAADRRDTSLKLYPACYRCHSGEYERSQDSVHAQAMAGGNKQAAVCTDCHTAHAVRQLLDTKTGQPLPDTRIWIPQTCAQCHNAIYQEYQSSVHGSALLGQGNPDVPTCIDCHGVHNISNPLANAFRNNSPEMCAKCHTDTKRMAKYGISTQVLNTYVSDFHGTTVTLFEKESPDAPTNKPVCFDCHGVHNIAQVGDPKNGLQIEQNLLARCKICHPDASANFPTAWLSHYIPTAKHNPLVFYVGWFYKLLIPLVLGGMAVLVVMDFGRSFYNRYQKSRPAGILPEPEIQVSQEEKPAAEIEAQQSSETPSNSIDEEVPASPSVEQATLAPEIESSAEADTTTQDVLEKPEAISTEAEQPPIETPTTGDKQPDADETTDADKVESQHDLEPPPTQQIDDEENAND